MTKLTPEYDKESVEKIGVARETLAEYKGRQIIVELFSRKMVLRLKGLKTDHATLYYDGAYETTLMNNAKALNGGIPSMGGRKAKVSAAKASIEELRQLGAWVRKGDYNIDDACDEIARAIENRIRQLEEMTDEQ